MTAKDIKAIIGHGANPLGRPPTDFYRTPEIATLKLLTKEKFQGPVLEPACGDGAMSEVLKAQGYSVQSQDLYQLGYGLSGMNFLEYNTSWPSIVTNPPFNQAEEFVWQGLKLTEMYKGKLALLLRLSFLEGQKRKEMFENTPLKNVYVFSKRVTFTRPDDKDKSYSGMMAYAWYVWDWTYDGVPRLGWI